MGGTEVCRSDGPRIEIVVGPLRRMGIIAKKGYRHVVAIEHSHAALQLGDNGIVPAQTCLARAAQVLGDGSHVSAIQIKLAQPAVFAIAHKQQRLIVARVECKSVTAIEQAGLRSLAGVTPEKVPFTIEVKDP